MVRWRLILHICLAAVVFVTTTRCVQVFAKSDAPGKQLPADQPLEDSEEKDESRSEAEHAALSPLDRGSVEDSLSQHWTQIPFDATTSHDLYRCRPDLSRAPPAV